MHINFRKSEETMSNGDLISDELRSGTEIIHTFIPGNKFEYREIKCSAVDGLAIFEGDIKPPATLLHLIKSLY